MNPEILYHLANAMIFFTTLVLGSAIYRCGVARGYREASASLREMESRIFQDMTLLLTQQSNFHRSDKLALYDTHKHDIASLKDVALTREPPSYSA